MTLVSVAPEAMTEEVATPPRRPSGRRSDSNAALLGIPAVVWYLFFMIGPLAAMFVISLLNWPSIIAQGEFIGFENFTRLFQDAVFWTAFVNTMIQLVIVLPIMIPAAFMAGYYLSLRPRGGRILSVLFFTPGLISVSTKAMIFFGVLSPNGALNGLLQAIGLDEVVTAWLANPASALACIIAVDLWSGIGYTAVLFSARLSSVPGEVYEAAKLDGSSQWRIMWGIAFPMVKDFFGVATMLQFLWTLFNSATIVLLLTKGGPGTSSTTLSFFVYEKAFVSSQVGYSQAAGVIVFIIGLAGMALIRRSFRANY